MISSSGSVSAFAVRATSAASNSALWVIAFVGMPLPFRIAISIINIMVNHNIARNVTYNTIRS